jgi:glucose/arabinose dehydrogenase
MLRLVTAIVVLGGCEACGAEPRTDAPTHKPPVVSSPAASSVDAVPEPSGPAPCELVADGHGPRGSARIKVEVVASGFEVPWGIAFMPGGDMLVTERPGRVVIVKKNGEVSQPVAKPEVSGSGEAGLLGIALHPDFAQNKQFYLYLTGRGNRVERWILDAKSARLDRVILGEIPSAMYHDGGRIRFGPDRMLYIGTGDAREPERSQDPDSFAGKILRVTPDGAVPGDNPIAGKAAFITGIRNTQGFDWFDARVLAVTDHGPSGEINNWSGHDEVNVAKGGDNLGWPEVRGCDERRGAISPSLSWRNAAPPGGASFYTGSAIPDWKGALLVGTLRSEHLHVVHFDRADRRRVVKHEVYVTDFGRLRDVVMGPDGHAYVTTSNCDGRGRCGPDRDKILRLLPAD